MEYKHKTLRYLCILSLIIPKDITLSYKYHEDKHKQLHTLSIKAKHVCFTSTSIQRFDYPVIHPSTNFHLNVWGDRFLTYTSDDAVSE